MRRVGSVKCISRVRANLEESDWASSYSGSSRIGHRFEALPAYAREDLAR